MTKRIPSLHIDEEKLTQVIYNIKTDYNIKKLHPKELSRLIIESSKGISCNNRSILVTNNRLEKKTKEILSSSKGDSILLADIIHKHRIKMKHRGINRIQQTDKEWPQVKKLANIALEFCNEFELGKREGFIEYIKLGLPKIKSSRQLIGKLISMQERIYDEYAVVKEIEDDPNPTETRQIFNYYNTMIETRTGLCEKNTEPLEYINFLRVSETTDKLDVPWDIYIKAQFEGLAWTDGYPSPQQLVGDKALTRLRKYLYENKIKLNSTPTQKESVLKRLKNGKNRSD